MNIDIPEDVIRDRIVASLTDGIYRSSPLAKAIDAAITSEWPQLERVCRAALLSLIQSHDFAESLRRGFQDAIMQAVSEEAAKMGKRAAKSMATPMLPGVVMP